MDLVDVVAAIGRNAKGFEYTCFGLGGTGTYDCSGLISAGLQRFFGCDLQKFRCADFTNKDDPHFRVRDKPTTDTKPNDIVVVRITPWGELHSGVVKTYDPITGNGVMYCALPWYLGGFGYYKFGNWATRLSGFDTFTSYQVVPEAFCPHGRQLPPTMANPLFILLNAGCDISPSYWDARTMACPAMQERQPSPDPLVLDLDGDGIQTTQEGRPWSEGRAFFDHNADGFAERTGWVSANDGLLVMDRNGDGIINNGRELFGSGTALNAGGKATSGFQALADLDSNHDGIINGNDALFSQLQVWQDTDEDGFSFPSELHTLSEVGIASINLSPTAPGAGKDAQGNTQNRVGSFTWTDGSTGRTPEHTDLLTHRLGPFTIHPVRVGLRFRTEKSDTENVSDHREGALRLSGAAFTVPCG